MVPIPMTLIGLEGH